MKKLNLLLLKSYIGPFVLTLGIAQFVLIMQFLWKYIDDLVGKGLETWIIVKLLVFTSVSLLPMSLPLAILLSSIMTLGSLGENYELTAVKSSGISFLRFIRPILILNILISIGAFFLSNNIIPSANKKQGILLYDIRKQKPTLNIKPGIFNDDIQGISIKVGSKDVDGKTLRDLIIYDHMHSIGNTFVITAKKGELLQTKNGNILIFKLENGSQYKEDLNNNTEDKKNQLFITNFDQWEKHFDLSQFALQNTDESFFKDVSRMCNITELQERIDTIRQTAQNRKNNMRLNIQSSFSFTNTYFDTIKKPVKAILPNTNVGLKMLDGLKLEEKTNVLEIAIAKARTIKSHTTNASNEMKFIRQDLNEFKVEYHRKIKLSFVCLLFFFIGAPFGAIIRKGGLGWPIFFSIIIFIFYYAINIIGERLAENAVSQVFTSTWMSILILTPLAIFLTIKSNNDSAIFNQEAYLNFIKKLIPKKKKK